MCRGTTEFTSIYIWSCTKQVGSTFCCFVFRSSDGSYTSQPPPRSFFPSSSEVLDFPYGNLDDVFEIVAEEEVLVVMYYAPWCATSMRFRDEFVRAAEYMKEEVLQWIQLLEYCWSNMNIIIIILNVEINQNKLCFSLISHTMIRCNIR